MSSETRLVKLGRLSELESELQLLEVRIKRNRQDVELGMFPKNLTSPVEGIDVRAVEDAFEEWKRAVEKYKEIEKKIKELKEELGIK